MTDTDTDTDFAGRLRLALGSRTIVGVAKAARIDRTSLHRLLRGEGKRGPHLDTVRVLARVCGVSFDWLAGVE